MTDECEHLDFEAHVEVVRLQPKEGDPVDGFTTNIRVVCKRCRIPFRWLGVGAGSSPLEPLTSVDGLELRAPITPEGKTMVAQIPGFRINARGPGGPPAIQ